MNNRDITTKNAQRNFRSMFRLLKPAAKRMWGDRVVAGIEKMAPVHIIDLVSKAPPLSKCCPFVFEFNGSLIVFAIALSLEDMGFDRSISGQEAAKLAGTYFENLPRLAKIMVRAKLFSPRYLERLKKAAKTLAEESSPGEWRMSSVHAVDDGFRVNYTSCGVWTLSVAMGRADLCPPVCALDFKQSDVFGYNLERKGTLSIGAPICDNLVTKRAASATMARGGIV